MLNIKEELIKYNFRSCPSRKILYIVLHNTADPGATAKNEHDYFSSDGKGASAHYFVDDKDTLRIVKDMDIAWHVGDGAGAYGITNSNSIGIEMCEIIGKDVVIVDSTLELVLYLMKKYNVPLEKVVRHYDASHKNCPRLFNPDKKWSKWIEFKNRLKQRLI